MASTRHKDALCPIVLHLVSVDPWKPVLDLHLNRFPIIIGQNGQSDICIPDKWVHSQHCEVSFNDGELVVRDLGSNSGTLVNGDSVDTRVLKPNDELTIGIRVFRVLMNAPKSKAAKSRKIDGGSKHDSVKSARNPRPSSNDSV